MAEKCDDSSYKSSDNMLDLTEEDYRVGIAAHKDRIEQLKAELRREESQVEFMQNSLQNKRTSDTNAKGVRTSCSGDCGDLDGFVDDKSDGVRDCEAEDQASGYVTVISVQENQNRLTKGLSHNDHTPTPRQPNSPVLREANSFQRGLQSFQRHPNIKTKNSSNSGSMKEEYEIGDGLYGYKEEFSAEFSNAAISPSYGQLESRGRVTPTEISKSNVDDGYASKDRSKSNKKDRVAIQIAPPIVPFQKSSSGEYVNEEMSERGFGCFESFSNENPTRLPRKESLRMFSSKESLKDSGTSSPRNNSPRFYGGKIGRSDSQSSSGSANAVTGTRSYMKDIEEPMYETSDANADFDETSIDYVSDTLKSNGSYDRSFVSSHHESISSLETVESPRPPPRLSLSSNAFEDYENCEMIFRRNARTPRGSTCVYEGPGKHRLPKPGDSIPDLTDDLMTPSVSTPDLQQCVDGQTPCDSHQASATDGNEGEASSSVSVDLGRDDVAAYRKIVASIIQSEETYLNCLKAMVQYMGILKASTETSKPIIALSEINSIFFKIPELHHLHSTFSDQLRTATENWDGTTPIAKHFSFLAQNLGIYELYLRNYNFALSTVRRCEEQSGNFRSVTSSIPVGGQKMALLDLLYKPVARVLQTAPVFNDLLANIPFNHPDRKLLQLSYSLAMTQSYVTSDISRISLKSASRSSKREKSLPSEKGPRQLAINTFVVTKVDQNRKLRRLFLFSDALVCTKQQLSSRCPDKDTLEVKWFIPLGDLVVTTDVDRTECVPIPVATLSELRLKTSAAREQILAIQCDLNSKKSHRSSNRLARERRKLAMCETELFLLSPDVPLLVANMSSKFSALFLFSSHFERHKWLTAIHALKSNTPPCDLATPINAECISSYMSSNRLQLIKSASTCESLDNRDRFLLSGNLNVHVHELIGLDKEQEVLVTFEFDSNQVFSRKAGTEPVCSSRPAWDEQFDISVDSATTMRVLCYRIDPDPFNPHPALIGRCDVELSQSWLTETMIEHSILLNRKLSLRLSLKFRLSISQQCPLGKHGELFGQTIKSVCERESRSVPFIITTCVREVERRGLHEIGIYRVSGMASNVNQLKKLFNTNMQQAEQMVGEVEIHSVTGLLKLYLRELPEGLFTQQLYSRFVGIFCSVVDQQVRAKQLLTAFAELPRLNQSIIVYLIEHMLKVHETEIDNKMSLNNLATVFGPTLLRSTAAMTGPNGEPVADLLTAGAIDVMAQAGVVFFFLQRRFNNEPIQVESEPPRQFSGTPSHT